MCCAAQIAKCIVSYAVGGKQYNAVTAGFAAYFNLTHPANVVRILGLDESEANLNWNVAVGMVRQDEKLRDAIEGALERLRSDGTVDRIYGRRAAPTYGRRPTFRAVMPSCAPNKPLLSGIDILIDGPAAVRGA
jgi:hypothetical protein